MDTLSKRTALVLCALEITGATGCSDLAADVSRGVGGRLTREEKE
jgi:hypothetical protein